VIKNIFFDFDGVIAESVNAKTEAFRKMYLPYGEYIAEQVVDHHINNGGVSRFEKFKYCHKNFLNIAIDENEVNKLADQFSAIVLDKVIQAKEVPGANDFIKEYYQKLKFWVITGTPTQEIEIIAKERGLESYFLGFHGSPKNKKYWTEYLLDKFHLKRDETLFIGDATTDYEAASHSNLLFALRETEENFDLFKNYGGLRFKNFDQLRIQIEKELA